jgi:hypothetical protein
MNTNIILSGWNAVISLPLSYSSGTKTYPTIIFFPGDGEIGTDVTKVKLNGPNAFIEKGWDGSISISGKTVEFIVVSIQPTIAYPRPIQVKPTIDALLSAYRVDTTNIFGTGLSRGGWVINSYLLYQPTLGDLSYQKIFKAIINIEGQRPDDNFGVGPLYPLGFTGYAKNGGKIIGFEQKNDGRDIQTIINAMNSGVTGSGIYTQTNFGNGGHGSWEQFYGNKKTTPLPFSLNGILQTIYQWMARVVINSTPIVPPPVNHPPTVTITSQNITLPSVLTLTAIGSDTDGDLLTYLWENSSSVATIDNNKSAITTVSGLNEGTYSFKVTVTDSSGLSASATTNVVVSPQPIDNLSVVPVSKDRNIGIEYDNKIITTTYLDSCSCNSNKYFKDFLHFKLRWCAI